MRALAALAVVTTHVAFQTGRAAQGTFGGVLARLDLGVAIFFVLSGFLLTRPWVHAAIAGRRAPSSKVYLWRRGLRILPAYWVVCATALIVLPQNFSATPADWARHALLLQTARAGDLAHGLTQTWSLAVEVAFYLLLPVLAALACRSLRRGRIASMVAVCLPMVAVAIGWQILTRTTDLVDRAVAGFWLPGYLGWFAAGIFLSVLASDAPRSSRLRESMRDAARSGWALWGIAAALLLISATPVAGPRGFEATPTAWEAVTKTLLYGAIACCLLIPAAFGTASQSRLVQALEAKPLRFLGEVSYGIFLWHLVALSLVLRWSGVAPFTGQFAETWFKTVSLTLLLATASLLLVERPVQRLRSRGPGATKARAATSATAAATVS
jgi:peptidoglycan/LPS O-acetylase OafA/YrhL